MHAKLLIFIFAVYLQYETVQGQRGWMSPQTTAQDSSAWFKPYYDTAWDAYGKFYQNAMDMASRFYQPSLTGGGWGNGGGRLPGGFPGGMLGGMPGGMPF